MVGFQNIAVHDYQSLNLDILENILRKELGVFEGFKRTLFDKGLCEEK